MGFNDPVKGNLMLRPDFTVPIVQLHIKTNKENAQYCYSGKVWRKQDYLSSRPSEYLQVGIECFGGSDIAKEDAKLFSIISKGIKKRKTKRTEKGKSENNKKKKR